jgi:hypothetical protein
MIYLRILCKSAYFNDMSLYFSSLVFRSGITSLYPKIKFQSVANFGSHLLIISDIFKELSFMINVHLLSRCDVLFFSQNSCSSWIENFLVV